MVGGAPCAAADRAGDRGNVRPLIVVLTHIKEMCAIIGQFPVREVRATRKGLYPVVRGSGEKQKPRFDYNPTDGPA